jgi:hypothetical protein
MDLADVGPWHQALGEGVADAAAERVDQGRIQQAPARVLPAPRPATYPQTRQSPAGGRWLVRARGCSRHSPGPCAPAILGGLLIRLYRKRKSSLKP